MLVRALCICCLRIADRGLRSGFPALLVSFLLLGTVGASPPVEGTYKLLHDGDGTKPKSDASVTITFHSGSFHLSAVQPGETFEDDGSYSLSDDTITLTFSDLPKSVRNATYERSGATLTLPFKLFGDGPGTSVWQQIAPAPHADGDEAALGLDLSGQGGASEMRKKSDGSGLTGPSPTSPNPIDDESLDQGPGEISCACLNKTFAIPSVCLQECKGGRLGCTHCMLAMSTATCPLYKADKEFITRYNQAVFLQAASMLGATMIGPGRVNWGFQKSLVVYIITKYYPPYKGAALNVTITPPSDALKLAELKSVGNRNTLLVSAGAFLRESPAGLVSILGHEMIHLEQLQRPQNLGTSMEYIAEAVKAFSELEAYDWETGGRLFKWKIGPNMARYCFTKQEDEEVEALRLCYEYRVHKAIEDLRESPRAPDGLKALEKWLDSNPWAKQVWLPTRQDWKTFKSPPEYAKCRFQ